MAASVGATAGEAAHASEAGEAGEAGEEQGQLVADGGNSSIPAAARAAGAVDSLTASVDALGNAAAAATAK